jgi:hypothetical protein
MDENLRAPVKFVNPEWTSLKKDGSSTVSCYFPFPEVIVFNYKIHQGSIQLQHTKRIHLTNFFIVPTFVFTTNTN